LLRLRSFDDEWVNEYEELIGGKILVGKGKFSMKTLSMCHIVHHVSHDCAWEWNNS
jgi:hypothetical protein